MKHGNAWEFAKKNGIDIFFEIPSGWVKDYDATTAPIGTVWINNRKSRFSGEYEHGLLIEDSVV